jgi:hypothetical protein
MEGVNINNLRLLATESYVILGGSGEITFTSQWHKEFSN